MVSYVSYSSHSTQQMPLDFKRKALSQNRSFDSGSIIIFTVMNQRSQHNKRVKTIINRVQIHFQRRVNARLCQSIGKANGPSTKKSMIRTIQGLSEIAGRIGLGSGTIRTWANSPSAGGFSRIPQ